jgi:uncharacterized protein (UPF0297 family)
MKATTEQLESIEFSKCKLPDFRGLRVHAGKAAAGPFPYIEAEGYFPIATRSIDEPYTWDARRATIDELEQIVGMCKTVDSFITSELSAIELAERREKTKPLPGDGFEYCDGNLSTGYSVFVTTKWSTWIDTITPAQPFSGDVKSYVFRRPIAKPEPKLPTVKLPVGCEWRLSYAGDIVIHYTDSNGGQSRTVPKTQAHRDRLAAMVSAYDEANGIKTISQTNGIVNSYDVNRYTRERDMRTIIRVSERDDVHAYTLTGDQSHLIGQLVTVAITSKPA